MRKFLRFSFIMFFFMIANGLFGQTVFDFDSQGAQLLGLSGESSSTSTAGDITEAKTATINGIAITISPKTSGTANRIWNASPKLRVYSGTITITAPTGKNLKQIEFSASSKWASNNTVNTGTIDAKHVWQPAEGNSTNSVTLTIAGNTQIKTITVLLDNEETQFTNATIEELNNRTSDLKNVNLTLTNAKVAYVDGKNIHIRENGKAIMLYNTNLSNLIQNATINGSLKVDYSYYYGIHEIQDNAYTNTDNLTINANSSEELDATETTISALLNKEHISDLVLIKNATITLEDNTYYITVGGDKIQLNGNKELSAACVGETADVYALFNKIMNGTSQIKPVKIGDVTTGINNVVVSKSDSNLYNTAGQRVDSSYKGIVIKNGKKVLVK